MLDFVGEPVAIVLIGALGGLLLGLAARLGKFCTLGMIEDVHYGHDFGRMWMWVTALGVAMMANLAAQEMGWLDLSEVALLGTRLSVAGAIVGGLLFGYGMAQAGNCGYGVLARLGGGDIRALMIAVVMGVSASATIFGILRPLRLQLFETTPSPSNPQSVLSLLESGFGGSSALLGGLLGAGLLVASILYQSQGKRLSRSIWGAVAGLAISIGFIGTYQVASTGFGAWDVESHSFTAPIGETIHYAMFSSGLGPKFGIGSVLGVIIGAAIGSLIQDGFRWEACEDPRELRRQIGGAAMMGVGAVLAAGCSIGQGLTALSLLSFTAPLVAGSIWLGTWLGLKHLIIGLEAAN
ncbi:YeeE/YedE family protein [Rhodobacterales bacterium HKCCE4037]|nr:YeeE/YedE family protein [Rhodobacterales bacterium HKCCE4037]